MKIESIYFCCLLGMLFGFICAKLNLVLLPIIVIVILIAFAVVVWKL